MNSCLCQSPLHQQTAVCCLQIRARVDILLKDINAPTCLPLTGTSGLAIDSQALVMSLGKPIYVNTFDENADVFVRCVLQMGAIFQRIDVVFDQYIAKSITAATRTKRTKGARPIRQVIETTPVPLPSDWRNVISLGENKMDLSAFLTKHLVAQAPQDKTIFVAGGIKESAEVNFRSCGDLDVL